MLRFAVCSYGKLSKERCKSWIVVRGPVTRYLSGTLLYCLGSLLKMDIRENTVPLLSGLLGNLRKGIYCFPVCFSPERVPCPRSNFPEESRCSLELVSPSICLTTLSYVIPYTTPIREFIAELDHETVQTPTSLGIRV